MNFFQKIKHRKTLKQLSDSRRYTEKRLSYHEAGHLVVSYLLGIPCQYIKSDVKMSLPTLENENITCEIKSFACVYHILPQSIENILLKFQLGFGIKKIASSVGGSSVDVLYEVMDYITITLAGYEAEIGFHNLYKNPQLDQFDADTANNFSDSREMDLKQLIYVMNKSVIHDYDKNSIVSCIRSELKTIMQHPTIDESIRGIADLAYNANGNEVSQQFIEAKLRETGLLNTPDKQLNAFKNVIHSCAANYHTT